MLDPLKMGPTGFHKMSVTYYQSTLRKIPEKCGSHLLHGKSLISHNN